MRINWGQLHLLSEVLKILKAVLRKPQLKCVCHSTGAILYV